MQIVSSCKKQVNLTNTFRKLWEQHIMWTRSFIISTANNLGDLEAVTNRLLRNPTDFANELSKYYGKENAKKFEKLLTDHLLIAAKLVNNAKAGNTAAVTENRKDWYENANDIAKFLSSINPYWLESKWKRMLAQHLEVTENEATKILTNQYKASVDIYDLVENQALEMADFMSMGILKQF